MNHVNCGSTRKCLRKLCHKFNANTVTSTKGIHEVAKKVSSAGHFLTKNLLENTVCLPLEKLDNIGTRLEHAPQKSLRHVAQETASRNISSNSYETA
jgi:hypothetical protein